MKRLFVRALAKEAYQDCTALARELYFHSWRCCNSGDAKNADYYANRWDAVLSDRDQLMIEYPGCDEPYTLTDKVIMSVVGIIRWFHG